MTLSAFRLSLLIGVCAAAIAAPAFAGNGYLTWANKSPAQTVPVAPAPTVTTSTGHYAIPPSPYGQVGDPYLHALNWSNRYGPAPQAQAQPQVQQAPVQQTAPVQPVASLTPPPRQPLPPQRTQPVRATSRYVDSAPAPQQIEPEDDAYEGTPASAAPPPTPTPAAPPPSSPFPKWGGGAQATRVAPEGSAPAPDPTPMAAAPAQPADDGGYQIPASSPYAARIAAARAAQAADQAAAVATAQTPPTKPIPAAKTSAKAAAQPAPTPAPVVATAPEPAEPLAADATDHVFIPGEQYTSAADAPRFYSLVREYGLKPDPITVDPNAGGALLTPLHDVTTNDDSDDSSGSDDGSDKDTSDTDSPTSP